MTTRARPDTVLLVLCCCAAALACSNGAKKRGKGGVTGLASAQPAPPPENERGIVGGPRDDTAFDFEPAPTDEAGPPATFDGTPEIPEQVHRDLHPYLEARRTRVASVGSRASSLLVLTRLGETTQVYAVKQPLGARTQLTFGEEPITQVSYAAGTDRAIIYRRDIDGNERYQVYHLDLDERWEARLTDGKSRHGPFRLSPRGALAFTGNGRSEPDMDIYLGGDARERARPELLFEREGQWLTSAWSRDGRRLILREYHSKEESMLHISDIEQRTIAPILADVEAAAFRDARFSADGTLLYFTSDYQGDFIQLYELPLDAPEPRLLTPDLLWDVESMALSSNGRRLAFVANEDGVSVLRLLDTETREISAVEGLPAGIISSMQFAGGNDVLALTLSTATQPADAYTYDLSTGRLQRWTESEIGGLPASRFVAPTLVRYDSFDDLVVPAYYYRPRGEGPFPVLLWIHGGPEEQYRPAFDPIVQYFVAELGIAVIAPNVRGSDGYGRRYRNLDNGTLRLDAVRDVGALLDWIAEQPELDAARVGIHGASYGGYMVLASLVELGDRLVAGSNVVGISNFVSFLENTAAYRQPQRRAEYGDERDPEMRRVLEELSPLSNASRIRSALLVAHGANDPRVPVSEAEQIVQAVRDGGGTVWYMLAPDEGHGFRKRRNRDAFYALMVTFFREHLLPADVAASE